METTATAPYNTNFLQTIPWELQLCVLDFLGYIDAIRLSQVNKHFNTNVKPQNWPAKVKKEFVLQAEKFQVHNGLYSRSTPSIRRQGQGSANSDNYACFSCFRVLDKSAFSRSQTQGDGEKPGRGRQYHGHKRFCIDCGLREGKYRPGSFFTTGPQRSSRVLLVVRDCCDEWFCDHEQPDDITIVGEVKRLLICRVCVKACEYRLVRLFELCKRCKGHQNAENAESRKSEGRKTFHVKCRGCKGISEVKMTKAMMEARTGTTLEHAKIRKKCCCAELCECNDFVAERVRYQKQRANKFNLLSTADVDSSQQMDDVLETEEVDVLGILEGQWSKESSCG